MGYEVGSVSRGVDGHIEGRGVVEVNVVCMIKRPLSMVGVGGVDQGRIVRVTSPDGNSVKWPSGEILTLCARST